MGRPLSKDAKYRRDYCIMCVDPDFHSRRFFYRNGYKSLLLREFVSKFPYHDVYIFVLSDKVIQNIK